ACAPRRRSNRCSPGRPLRGRACGARGTRSAAHWAGLGRSPIRRRASAFLPPALLCRCGRLASLRIFLLAVAADGVLLAPRLGLRSLLFLLLSRSPVSVGWAAACL